MATYDGHLRSFIAIEQATQVGEANASITVSNPDQATPDALIAETKFFQFAAKALVVGELRATLADATLSSTGVVT